MTSTFWGLRLEPGKRYSTTVDKSFHVSMAALDCTTVKTEKEVHSVMLEEGESNIPFILCNLQKPKVIQSPLNLNFVSGDRVTFFCRGHGTVHLTGYLMVEDDDFAAFGEESEEVEEEEEEEEEEENEEEEEEESALEEKVKGKIKLNGLPGSKRKGDLPVKTNQKKKLKVLPQSDDDEDEDEDDGEEMEDESLDEEEEEESEEESEEIEDMEKEVEKPSKQQPQQQQQKKNKKQKKQQQQQQQQALSPGQQQQPGKQKQKQQNGLTQQSPGQQKKKGNEEKTNDSVVPVKKTLEGGVVVKDLKVGNGPVCKPGRMVSVYYVGKLKSNNKVFDQTTQGSGFKFRLGRSEVIKGWDVGLAGMKVGGKRLITCPPNMAYGQKGSPPTIPGNSTLMFEVELKAVD